MGPGSGRCAGYSAENRLGYHVATLLSLHVWFSEHRGSVPRTLILDQPTMVGRCVPCESSTPVSQ
ncbi:DUF3732 domain-containing protein [Streptomyces sp. NPDC058657]|uniref:DUF3732 domain-containing protein n=1 Tax=unclassified Streptomyces TaxID=2593676 RepID=UPI00365172AA